MDGQCSPFLALLPLAASLVPLVDPAAAADAAALPDVRVSRAMVLDPRAVSAG